MGWAHFLENLARPALTRRSEHGSSMFNTCYSRRGPSSARASGRGHGAGGTGRLRGGARGWLRRGRTGGLHRWRLRHPLLQRPCVWQLLRRALLTTARRITGQPSPWAFMADRVAAGATTTAGETTQPGAVTAAGAATGATGAAMDGAAGRPAAQPPRSPVRRCPRRFGPAHRYPVAALPLARAAALARRAWASTAVAAHLATPEPWRSTTS